MKARIKRPKKSAVEWLNLFGLICLTHFAALNAGVMEVTGFTQISGAKFYDAPASNCLTTVTIGTVVITPNVSLVNESFAGVSTPLYTADVPGDGAGFGSDPSGFGGATPLMLNFTRSVAAFGATFVHSQNTAGHSAFTFPTSIQVFSGLNGDGTLLGTIVDDPGGVTLQGTSRADFRGLWSDSPQIRSAEISSVDQQSGGFQVDGFAISLDPMPTPEPLTLVLAGGGLVGLGIAWRYTGKRF